MSRPKMEPKYSAPFPASDTDAIPTTVGVLGLSGLLLTVEEGPRVGQQFKLQEGESIIGRASAAHVRIEHPSISRQHACLLRRGERYFLRDLGSQNGTFLNRSRIESEVEVYRGDEIAIGNAVLRLIENLQASSLAPPPTPAWSTSAKSSLSAAPVPTDIMGAPSSTIHASMQGRKGAGVGQTAILAGLLGLIIAGVVLFTVIRHSGENPVGVASATSPAEPAIEVITDEPVVRTVEKELLDAPNEKADQERNAIVTRYDQGMLGGALDLARSSPYSDLFEALTRFQQAYEDGKAAGRNKDFSRAIELLETALKLDQGVSTGTSYFHSEIKKELSELLVAQARVHQANNDAGAARKSLRTALSYNRKNGAAQTLLENLNQPEERAVALPKKPAKKGQGSRTDFGDDAEFAADEKPKRKTSSKVRSAIDDAFDE